MLREKIYFIAAVGTDIGKTFFVEKLCRNLQEVTAIKPIASGFVDGDQNSDTVKILSSLSLQNNSENIAKISPWRFEEAASPHFAAQNCNSEIDFLAVKKFCQEAILQAQQQQKYLFIEAAGGIMTPINYDKTFLDLAAELQIPLLLVTANYLGAISHTLTAIKALQISGVSVEKIIINQDAPISAMLWSQDISETIEKLSKVPTISLTKFFEKLA